MTTTEKLLLIISAFAFVSAIILALNGISKRNEENE
jgi:hypothetical protein